MPIRRVRARGRIIFDDVYLTSVKSRLVLQTEFSGFHEISILPLSDCGAQIRIESSLKDYMDGIIFFEKAGSADAYWKFSEDVKVLTSGDQDLWIRDRAKVFHSKECTGENTPHIVNMQIEVRFKSGLDYVDTGSASDSFSCHKYGRG